MAARPARPCALHSPVAVPPARPFVTCRYHPGTSGHHRDGMLASDLRAVSAAPEGGAAVLRCLEEMRSGISSLSLGPSSVLLPRGRRPDGGYPAPVVRGGWRRAVSAMHVRPRMQR